MKEILGSCREKLREKVRGDGKVNWYMLGRIFHMLGAMYGLAIWMSLHYSGKLCDALICLKYLPEGPICSTRELSALPEVKY